MVRPRSKLALVVGAAALLTGAGERLELAGAGSALGRARPVAAARAQARALDAKKFAAPIAEHLHLVPDPEIVLATDVAADNEAYRHAVIRFVRAVAAGERATCALAPEGSLAPIVWLYQDGAPIGRGESASGNVCVALKDATRRAVAAAGARRETVETSRFVVELPEQDFAVIEHEGKGVELTNALVPVRVLDKALVRARLDDVKEYLLRAMDPQRHGVHKVYHADTDSFEDELHTIYTASTALTLLKLHAREHDPELLERARRAATFTLSMQHRAPADRASGGFYYSLDTKTGERDERLIVGTASKTIFTLLELHRVTRERPWLDAAIAAADWLVTMQRPDGSVRSHLRREPNGKWTASTKQSLLYTGQVVSALSRTYRVTRRAKYLDAAASTATWLADLVAERGCYLGDDYRRPNAISSSWVVLSLLDFVKASGDARTERLVLRCADDLLSRQIRDPSDAYRAGRWKGALSSSGNGWLAEVTSEVYLHCRERDLGGCERFKDAVVAAARNLLQYTFSPANAFLAKNPEAANGGVFWSARDRFVRTDSVCHSANAYLNILDHLGDEALLRVPERPLSERIALAASRREPREGDVLDEPDAGDAEP
ncbi:MAG: terpene cyclase [Deltaproteobacteria bacterium]|nr:terpene cyclase [Deltaproteobacteria bacterium]